jgi:pilus assembly protein CpaE
VISSRNLWEQAHACIQSLPIRIALEQNEPDDADALLDRIDRHRADVVLIEAQKLGMPLEEFIRRLRDTSSQPATFVLHPEASPQHILDALRAGAAEFLYSPLTETLREAFERLGQQRAKSDANNTSGLGQIFGFMSARGGCGATTFAAHVAVSVSKQLAQPVLLADLDFESGMLRFLLKAKTPYSIGDALENLHRMDSSYWKALVSKHSAHLDLIASPDDLAARRPADSREVAHLMRFIRSVYPVTIVDFGRHVNISALDCLPELESLYLLSTSELSTLDRTKDCVADVLERGFERRRLKILMNRATSQLDMQSLEEFLGIDPSAAFSSDYPSLYEAWSEGRLLEPDTRLGRELKALARTIVATSKGETAAPLPKLEAQVSGIGKWFPGLSKALTKNPASWMSGKKS